MNVQNLRLLKSGGTRHLHGAWDSDDPETEAHDPVDRRLTAELLCEIDADVVALQEVYDLETFEYFHDAYLLPAGQRIGHLLPRSELQRAEILGRALLLGHRFSASVPEILAQSRLKIDADAIRLEVEAAASVPDSDAVQSRLRQLAKVAGIDAFEIAAT